MFVPYKPSRILDIQRKDDRCICCATSALITYHDGINAGYCLQCAQKRQKFVENIIGNINLEKRVPIIPAQSWINLIEQTRKNYMQERIYYMIDRFFANKPIPSTYNILKTTKYEEPYQNDKFISQAYYEKAQMRKNFIQNLPNFLNDNLSNQIYTLYLLELNKMYETDYKTLSKIDAKIEKYPYQEEKTHHSLIKIKKM